MTSCCPALALADRIAANPPLAVRKLKQGLRTALDPDWDSLGRWVSTSLAELFRTEDHREGVASFLERREPRRRPVGAPESERHTVDFEIPEDLADYLVELDEFIEREIRPLEEQDDNVRFFDHRREHARTDWDRGGLPAVAGAAGRGPAAGDAAGHYRYQYPKEYGGQGGSNLGMAVIREHLAHRAWACTATCRTSTPSWATTWACCSWPSTGPTSRRTLDRGPGRSAAVSPSASRSRSTARTPPTWRSAVRDGEWVVNGEKIWNSGMDAASHDLVFARTHGEAGDGEGITAFLVPTDSPGFEVLEFLWTFNMPTDHAHIRLSDVRVPEGHLRGRGPGLQVVQHFFNENRIRQAASSLGAAQYCIDRAVEHAKVRKPFGKPWRPTRASSSRSWSCRPRPRCCGR